jgi:primosomal protein N' (replication factor Y)
VNSLPPSSLVAHRSSLDRIARVVLVPPQGRLGPLDYRVPPELGAMVPGTRVLVPLGSRRSMGMVVALADGAEHPERLRDIAAVLDAEPLFDAALLELVAWLGEYYLAPLAEAVNTALPGALRVETERVASLVDGAPTSPFGKGGSREIGANESVSKSPLTPLFQRGESMGGAGAAAEVGGTEGRVVSLLRAEGPQSVGAIERRLGSAARGALQRLGRKGIVRVEERLRREVAPTRWVRLYEAAARLADDDPTWRRRPALLALYRYLRDHPLGHATQREIGDSFADSARKLRALADAGLVRWRQEERYRTVLPPIAVADREVALTAAQTAAVEAIVAGMRSGFSPFLLLGVTGSGKTEVYLRAIAEALAGGRTALVLVPEISLTHQLVDRTRARFGERVAVLHSQLSDGERWDQWRRIARGEAPIVVGARSAVFAPLRRIGVVIVDEEHDGAYKQADGVHYHGRDVAVMRAKLAGGALVLGSATPAMESWANAQGGRYRLLELPERVEARPLPEVEILDLRGPKTPPPISAPLAAAIEAHLAAGGQCLVFLNRRGFANFLQCRACGDPLMCPNCSVTLTFHRQWRALRCHYCDHTIAPPAVCGGCGEPALQAWGVGTEQLEAMLREMFPGARIGRMDRDTTRRKGSLESILAAWSSRRLDILVGTQMVTKGHDVPGVTLVGVVLADLSLSFPDFRSAERTFQLLAQVAGRAGRGDIPGRVIVQTLQPHHVSLRAAAAHDFAGFAARELEARRELGYPPFSRLVLVRIEGESASDVDQIAGELGTKLREIATRRFGVLGPAPAPIERLRQRHRRQILLRGRTGAMLRKAVAEVMPPVREAAHRRDVRLVVDVDPQHML